MTSQQAGMSSTYVCLNCDTGLVLAYYALAAGGLSHEAASSRVAKGVPRHEIPVIILVRMAVDVSAQGQGLGQAMMRDALVRVDAVADTVGIRCLLIHAKDERARAFYLRFAEFEPSPTDPMNLQLMMKDLRLITRA